MSTRNAGAKASPAEVPPNRPSKPGTTHHQGKGSSPLNDATNGFSTCNIFRIFFHSVVGQHRNVSGEVLSTAIRFRSSGKPMFLLFDLVFATATAFIRCWLIGFDPTRVQMAIHIGPIKGAHKPAVRGGNQDVVHFTRVESLED